MRKSWPQIKVAEVEVPSTGQVLVGDSVPIKATVVLGPIPPEEVAVQAYYGPTVNQEIVDPAMLNLTLQKAEKGAGEGGTYVYYGTIPAAESGSYGLSV